MYSQFPYAAAQDGHFLKTSCGSPNYVAPELMGRVNYAILLYRSNNNVAFFCVTNNIVSPCLKHPLLVIVDWINLETPSLLHSPSYLEIFQFGVFDKNKVHHPLKNQELQ
ncbi:hypothetical protein ACSBR1_037876 [Camellia fascicularis]